LQSIRRLVAARLLTLDTNHCGTGAYHIEFTSRSAAEINDATSTVRPAINNSNDDGLSISNISNRDHRAKRQGSMSGGHPVRPGYLATCCSATAIECGATGLGMDRTNRDCCHHGSQGHFKGNHRAETRDGPLSSKNGARDHCDRVSSLTCKHSIEHGVFASAREAVAACKQIVDECLKPMMQPGMTANAMYEQYVGFGDDPFLCPLIPMTRG
jgi:hypothetical protein